MKVRYIRETKSGYFTQDQIYEVLSIERGWYRIIDDSGEDYLYPPDIFKIVENKPVPPVQDEPHNMSLDEILFEKRYKELLEQH